jgi:outer membrane protein assembly factor BamD
MEIYAHYEGNQYDEAVADANRFIELYPGNPTAAYAYYIRAECYFEEILDVGRDQASTLQAQINMREVYRRFPTTEYATDARLKLDMISDQLAGKEMTVGRYYLRAGDTLAAIGRFKTVIDKYQTTSHAPEALYRLVEAYLTLGLIEEAQHNAAVLGFNYPGDRWYADAYKLMTDKGLQPAIAPTSKGKGGLLHRAVMIFDPAKNHGSALPPPSETTSVNTPAVQPATSSETPAEPVKKKKKGPFGWF